MNILEMVNRREKRGRVWDSVVLVQHMFGTFDVEVFKVILGTFGALAILPQNRFSKRYSFSYAFFQHFIDAPSR